VKLALQAQPAALNQNSVESPEFVTKLVAMTLKSALEDVKRTTLSAVSGLLAKLAYLSSLRRGSEEYDHWGLRAAYGPEAAEHALRTAHAQVVAAILKTPLALLVEDLEVSRDDAVSAAAYVNRMRDHFENLLPPGRQSAPSAAHLSSVLAALSSLEQHREPAIPSAS